MRILAIVALLLPAPAGDQPQWGQKGTRNMVSEETGLPETFDPASGAGILWTARLGTETYSTPIVAGGRVLIGTNNEHPRDPRLPEDRGVLLCLDARDGKLAWQLALSKRGPTPYWDWPKSGMASPATVDGDRVFMVTNRGEVVCLDLQGMANGNDGPFKDEGALFVEKGTPPLEPGPADADVLWLCDLTKEAGVRQHDSAHCSILVDGPFLYVNTSNGLNDKHSAVENPEAPSLVVLEKATGRILAREKEGIARGTFHCTWSSPSVGDVNGRRLVFLGGGDGVCYAFEALREAPSGELPAPLKLAWKFDCDPAAPKEDIHKYVRNRKEGPSNISSMPVFHDGRVYVTHGGDVWWGKNQAELKCIDATKSGDVTTSALVWSSPLRLHSMSTAAIRDGLVYVSDSGKTLHCIDAATGKSVWTHDAEGEMWASPLLADGRIYIGTRGKLFWILAAGREKRVLARIPLKEAVCSTATAAGGVLYVATQETLYAIAKPR